MNATIAQTSLAAARAVPIADREQLDLVDLAGDLAARAANYANAAKAANTQRGYRSDWRAFEAWCAAHGVTAMPAAPETVIAYLVAHAGALKVSTLRRRLAAIRECHRSGGVDIDTGSTMFRDTWKGIRRTHGRPADKRAPSRPQDCDARTGDAASLAAGPAATARLLLIGFAGALRTELARLEAAPRDGANWIEETPEGLIIHLGCTKNRPERSRGEQVAHPIRHAPRDVPTAGLPGLAAGVRDPKRAGVSADRPARPHEQQRDNGWCSRAHRKTDRRGRGDRRRHDGARGRGTRCPVLGSFAAGGARHERRSQRRAGPCHSAPAAATGISSQILGYIRDGRLFKNNAAGSAGL